mmetsp:Transcript_1538/g.4218  ORF Transcript_1538/g.4218 Transcript_1538/m.4218 type:complete len:94 (+) Transcript_1538:379-660(+)
MLAYLSYPLPQHVHKLPTHTQNIPIPFHTVKPNCTIPAVAPRIATAIFSSKHECGTWTAIHVQTEEYSKAVPAVRAEAFAKKSISARNMAVVP